MRLKGGIFIKNINEITNISLIENAKLNNEIEEEYNTFISIEDYDDIKFLYNLTTGKDLSFIEDNSLYIDPKKTKITQLYIFNKKDDFKNIKLGELESIEYYKRCHLLDIKNKYKNKLTHDCLEFNYKDGFKMYVDVSFNNIFIKQKYISIVKKNYTKQINIYREGKSYNITKKVFRNIPLAISKLFFEFV